MAEGLLLNIVAGLVANVAAEPFKMIRLPFGLMGFKDELRKLNNTLTTIQAVLLDAEEKKETNNQVKVWLDRLEEVVYEADNLLDEFRYQCLRRKVIFGKKKAKKVRIFFSRSNQLVFRMKVSKKIKHIRDTLDEIKDDQIFLQLVKRDQEERQAPSPMSWRESHSFITDDVVIGRDDDKKKILELLLDSNVETAENVSIISLVGIGGLGKTTLAQFVFNDKSVEEHFDKQKWWVCVSDITDLKSLVQKIIKSVTGESLDQTLDLEQLQNKLRPKLEGRRYLLVLDDVWSEDSRIWDGLKTFLKLGAKGSRVLITTRSREVAQIVSSTKTHMLSALDEDKSWNLFEKVAFEKIDEPTARYNRLIKIGEGIVGKCKGIPLAIKTIGRLLQSKMYSSQDLETEWINFRDIELAEVDQNVNDILPTLKLSYNNLPSHLKHCFAYCSLFPKDYRIDVQQLIRLWIAQGFIKSDRNKQPEEIGYENFFILFSRCFFQEAETDKLSSRTIEYCKMHDLMHDLASLVAGKNIKIVDENFIGQLEKNTNSTGSVENAFEKVRHLCINFQYDSTCQLPTPLLEQKKVRSFILPELAKLSLSEIDDILTNFKLLRVLSLKCESGLDTLPNRFDKLKHLRYLDLSENESIKELPNSITRLYYLETLNLFGCQSLVSLPVDIQNLISLRHLKIEGCCLTHIPRGIGELTSLQSLDCFIIAENQSTDSAGFYELGKLNNLHGGLNISINSLYKSKIVATQYLKDKKHLESLYLEWNIAEEMMENAKEAFESLELPQTIKFIIVDNYPGETFPNWLSSLTNLVRLELSYCTKCKYLPSLYYLSSLKELELDHLSSLEYVSVRDRGWDQGDHLSTSSESVFISLTKLEIWSCDSLKGWCEVEGALTEHQQQLFFHNLAYLEIRDCPVLTSIPLSPNLKELYLRRTSSKPLERMIAMKLKSDSVATSIASSSSQSSFTLSKLKELTISNCSDLESLPEAIENLSSLTNLKIEGCSNLTSLPEGIGSLSSLTDLRIYRCSNLTSIPEGIGSLSSLTDIVIDGCSDLTSLPERIGSLSSLTNLKIEGCSNLTSLPEGIGSLSSLTDLRIYACSNLTSIPEGIGSLSSLTNLVIDGCRNLTSLPEGIGSLCSLKYVNWKPWTEISMKALADYLLQQNKTS